MTPVCELLAEALERAAANFSSQHPEERLVPNAFEVHSPNFVGILHSFEDLCKILSLDDSNEIKVTDVGIIYKKSFGYIYFVRPSGISLNYASINNLDSIQNPFRVIT